MNNLGSQQQLGAKEPCQLPIIGCPTSITVSLPAEPFPDDGILLVRGAEAEEQAGDHHWNPAKREGALEGQIYKQNLTHKHL